MCENENAFYIPVTCNSCNEIHKVYCKEEDYNNWKDGSGFIQDIMDYVPPALRELLISGTCGKCFDEMFKEEDEEDDDVFSQEENDKVQEMSLILDEILNNDQIVLPSELRQRIIDIL
jgi:hypothetical protein